VFPTPVRLSGSDSGRLDNEQLREAWSIIERLITHGADTDTAIDAAFSHLVDGQDLLKIGPLKLYRSVKQRPKPYNTKLQFVNLREYVALYNSKKPEPNLSVAMPVLTQTRLRTSRVFSGRPCLSGT